MMRNFSTDLEIRESSTFVRDSTAVACHVAAWIPMIETNKKLTITCRSSFPARYVMLSEIASQKRRRLECKPNRL